MAEETLSEREIVLDILTERERTHRYSNVLVRNTLDRYAGLPLAQRSFIKRLSEGTIEREIELDAVIRRFLRDPRVRMKPIARCALRMAIYEIYYMDSVTDYAAVDEAVKLLRKKGFPQLTGFVNGVLRSVCRDKAAQGTVTENNGARNVVTGGGIRQKPVTRVVVTRDAETGKVTKKVIRTVSAKDAAAVGNEATAAAQNGGQGLANASRTVSADAPLYLRYSMPRELVDMWIEDYGEAFTEQLLDAMMNVRPVCIRFSPDTTDEERGRIVESLRENGAVVEKSKWLPDCYKLSHVSGVATLPGFAEGRWTVQDESSQLVCAAAELTGNSADLRKGEPAGAGMMILDLCAAPGGKSLHAAALAPGAVVYSFDLTKSKTDRIRENAQRLHLANLVIEEHDATEYNPEFDQKADIVLCDVPCSGLGVITRKRDIKYNVTREKIHSLTALQKKIMKNAVNYVKPGGVLIYSTCTINRSENDRMAAYIEKKLGMMPDDLAPYLPDGIPGIEGNQIQLLPSVHGTDGFFIARFRKM